MVGGTRQPILCLQLCKLYTKMITTIPPSRSASCLLGHSVDVEVAPLSSSSGTLTRELQFCGDQYLGVL
jgi:hypothetical protein